MDAWPTVHPDEPGYTWDDGERGLLPAGRLDRVALLEMQAVEMKVLPAGPVVGREEGSKAGYAHRADGMQDDIPQDSASDGKKGLYKFSDHSGVYCVVSLHA